MVRAIGRESGVLQATEVNRVNGLGPLLGPACSTLIKVRVSNKSELFTKSYLPNCVY